ncbi:MAG: Uncharacterized protein FD138_4098, partial [Planctomycetota bacterium]
DDVVKQYDERAKGLKDFEKKLADTQADEVRKFGESLAPQVSKYIVAAWTLQNRKRSDPKFGTTNFASLLALDSVLLDRWAQFLTLDNVRQRVSLTPLKPLFEQQNGKGDLSQNEAAKSAIEAAATSIQEQLVAALRTRDEQEAEFARKVSDAAEAERSKIAKPKLEQHHADLIKELLTDNKAPLLIPKDRLDKVLPDASQELLATMQKELEQLKQGLGTKYPVAHSLSENSPTNLKVHLRGNHKDLGDEVPRRFLSILSPAETTPGSIAFGSTTSDAASSERQATSVCSANARRIPNCSITSPRSSSRPAGRSSNSIAKSCCRRHIECGVRNSECGILTLPFRLPNSHFRLRSIPTTASSGGRIAGGWISKRGEIPCWPRATTWIARPAVRRAI